MPRIVDHNQQRDQISDAVLSIAARDGLGGVTMSQVAAESRVSKGSVQHYFTSKQDLLLHASRRLRARIAERIDAATMGSTAEDVLRGVLRRMLPTTDRAREESRAGKALFTVALNDPILRKTYRNGLDELSDLTTTLLRDTCPDMTLADGRRHAAALLGLAGHLGDLILLGSLSSRAAGALIDSQIGAIVTAS